MAHVKRFKEINESVFYFSDYVDLDLLQKVIDGMKPTSENREAANERFKKSLIGFNDNYTVKDSKRLPSTMGKQVAWWVDLYLVQDVIDRMNPVVCKQADEYKKDLKEFLS